MALNRAWYNALVDDDGSNTVGTVWGKDDIKNLLDSVDLEIARLDSKKTTWTPTITTDGGSNVVQAGTTSVQAEYAINGDQLFWHLAVVGMVIPVATGYLRVAAPPGYPTGYYNTPVVRLYTAAGYEVGYMNNDPSAVMFVHRMNAAWAAGSGQHVFGQGFYFIR
jgi:hypothetical protein